MRFKVICCLTLCLIVTLGFVSFAPGGELPAKLRTQPQIPSSDAVKRIAREPSVILQQKSPAWIPVHLNSSYCPGDPLGGHGGEATGGPLGFETWCFEHPEGDSCGTNPPWDVKCFQHMDVRTMPSPSDTNFWHLDTYRTDEWPWCGNYCLWCGSDSLWRGEPVDCGRWANTPGYGNDWNCIVQLALDGGFDVADGCTVLFDPRYDTECKYDYFYLEVWDGEDWVTGATFNATSDNPGPECGGASGGNPDYWGNTDIGQPVTCRWQTRVVPGRPAFEMDVTSLLDTVTVGPSFRWRFNSDLMYSDEDGVVDTDGAAFIDNVWILSGPDVYVEDFEHGSWSTLEARGWTRPDPDPVLDAWHIVHDSDPPYEGGDGGDRTSCVLDSSMQWRARPEQGYPAGVDWRNRWCYRLMTPTIPIMASGCRIQYDQFMCCLPYYCDLTDTKVRFHDSGYGRWCPWVNIDGALKSGGCFFWDINKEEDLTMLYSPDADSLQFGWDIMDLSRPGDFCFGHHYKTNNIIDNVSIDFYNGDATMFSARGPDLLHDSFHKAICGYNSFFEAYNPGVVAIYSAPTPPPLPTNEQLNVDVIDKDGLIDVRLYGSVNRGKTWVYVPMTLVLPAFPSNPGMGGQYYATLDHTDFAYPLAWPRGTEVWYFVKAFDSLSNVAYFPAQASPGHPDHANSSHDYFSFTLLPAYPVEMDSARVLLVDGFDEAVYDWAPCLNSVDNILSGLDHGLEDIYEQVLVDAGYCYDKFDVTGAGYADHIHCIWPNRYDAIVWFTGPQQDTYLFDKEAQDSIRSYLKRGGKMVVSGDRIAYNLADEAEGGMGCDSMAGEFISGVLGCDYLQEMHSPFEKPYIYLEGMPTVTVLGTPLVVPLDSLVLYRECPGLLRDMSCVLTEAAPPAGYLAQPLLTVLNPDPECDPSDGAIYVESFGTGVGQCVFIDFDLAALVNHETRECDSDVPAGVPHYVPGVYEGRVELMRFILEDMFGLPSNGPGGGGTSGFVPPRTYRWALGQNTPNPCPGPTEIRFEVARTSNISIKVYNAAGQLVRTLVAETKTPGEYSARWTGRNDAGERVSSGVYFYRMEAGDFAATRKLLLLK